MKKIAIGCCLFVQLVVFGQQKKTIFTYSQVKKKFEQLQFRNPDSSKIYLDQILAHKNQLHDTLVAKAYNDYGVYYAITNRDSLAIASFNTSIAYFGDHVKSIAGEYINIANVYKNAGKYDKALAYLKKALVLFEEEKEERGIALVYGDMSANYYYQLKSDEAVTYALKSIDYFKKSNDFKFLAIQKFRLANMYSKMENFQFAIKLYKECMPEFEKEKQTNPNFYLSKLNLGDCYFELNQLDQAITYYQEASKGLKAINNTEFYSLAIGRLGKIHLEQKEYSKAQKELSIAFYASYDIQSPRVMEVATDYINVLRLEGETALIFQIIQKMEAFPDATIFNIEDKMYFLQEKAVFYKSQKLFQLATAAFEQMNELKDQLYDMKAEEQAKDLQAKYQNQIQSQENEVLEAKVVNNRILMVLICFFAVVIGFGIYYYYKIKYYKISLKANRAEVLEQEQELLKAQAAFDKQNIKNLDEIAELKQRELTALTMQFASMQETFAEIMKKSTAEEGNNQLINNIKSALSQKDYWSEFVMKFSQVHPDFSTNLKAKYPTLTQKDISFCTLIKLNLSNKEIANMMQVSHASIISKKYLLKRKLQLTDEQDLMAIISSIN